MTSDTRALPVPSVPWLDEAATRGVLTRRAVAFVLDAAILGLFLAAAHVVAFLFGVVTLGLGFLLWGLVFPLVAFTYYAMTLGRGATPGMDAMSLRVFTLRGERPGALLAMAHALLFAVSVSLLTPLVLLVGLFTRRRRQLHDLVLGLVVVDARAPG